LHLNSIEQEDHPRRNRVQLFLDCSMQPYCFIQIKIKKKSNHAYISLLCVCFATRNDVKAHSVYCNLKTQQLKCSNKKQVSLMAILNYKKLYILILKYKSMWSGGGPDLINLYERVKLMSRARLKMEWAANFCRILLFQKMFAGAQKDSWDLVWR
jgi:hypothetical protein